MSSLLLTTALSICFVAGKSGGHLLPCITQASQMQQTNKNAEIYLFSCGSALDHMIVDKYPKIAHITPTLLDNPPYGKPWLMPWFACKTGWYFLKSIYYLWKINPQKMVSFGGFVAIPACLAAKAVGIPIEIYELNVEPGKATNLLAKFTDTIHTCFASTQKYFPSKKCVHFDYPIRFTQQDLIFDRQELLSKFGLKNDRMTVLILGGSQGSVLLNETFKKMVETYPSIANKVQVIHQTGTSDPFDYASFYKQKNIPAHVFGYCQKLQDFYNVSDMIVCRAGAGTLFEIKFFGKNCVTIPHETANTNHQIQNVLELQVEHPSQFQIIKQGELTPELLLKAINL